MSFDLDHLADTAAAVPPLAWAAAWVLLLVMALLVLVLRQQHEDRTSRGRARASRSATPLRLPGAVSA